MNEFMIRFASAENALSTMQQVESEIRSNGEEISKIRSSFHAEFGGRARILQELHSQISRMSDLGDCLETFETSLESILGVYNAVEENLLGQARESARRSLADNGSYMPAEDVTGSEETVDRIHRLGRQDQRGGLIAGASLIGAATLGRGVNGDSADAGNGSAQTNGTEAEDGQKSRENAADTVNSEEAAEPAVGDLNDLKSSLADYICVFPEEPVHRVYEILKEHEQALWEGFLNLFPVEVISELTEPALDYLHELFEMIRLNPNPFGEVFIPGAAEWINCGIWTTFYTLITWYFYQRGIFPADGATGIDSGDDAENSVSVPGDETGDSISVPGESDHVSDESSDYAASAEEGPLETQAPNENNTAADGQNGTSAGESPLETQTPNEKNTTAAAKKAASAEKSPLKTQTPNEKNAAAAAQNAAERETPESSGGSKSGGHSGGSGGSTGGGSSYAGEPAVEIPEAGNPVKDYISDLVGESGTSAESAGDWSLEAMKNWGEKAAEQAAQSAAADLAAGAAAAGSGTGAIGRTARSVLCAAVINAGIELAMHGAGAAGSLLGGGKEDMFTEVDLEELQ